MNNEVTIALISLISASIVAFFGYMGQKSIATKKSEEDARNEAKRQQYLDDRDDYFEEQIKEIKDKLDVHNHYAKKFEEVEIKLTKLETLLMERTSNEKSRKKN
jgi:Na+-translocating ferredoxin:NAD+ oxidoreductase RnfG subunit